MAPALHGKSMAGSFASLPAFFFSLLGATLRQVNLHFSLPWFLSVLERSRQVYCTLPMHFVWGCGAVRVCFPSYTMRRGEEGSAEPQH